MLLQFLVIILRNLLFSQTEKKNQMLRYNYKASRLIDCPTISECTWIKKLVHKQSCNEKLQSCSGKWKMGHLQFSVESSLLSQVTQRDEVQCQLLPWNMEVDRSRSLFFFVPQSSCHETCKGRGPIIWQMSWKKGSFTHTPPFSIAFKNSQICKSFGWKLLIDLQDLECSHNMLWKIYNRVSF